MSVAQGLLVDCQEMVEMPTGYLDGAMDEPLRSAVEAHLELCDGCGTYLDQLQMTRGALAALPAPQLPAELQRALLAKFREHQP